MARALHDVPSAHDGLSLMAAGARGTRDGTMRGMSIVPDTKDWTWVLERPCPQCGYDAAAVRLEDLPGLFRENTLAWSTVLDEPRCVVRPDEATWSPLEYACHVRDVHRVFAGRVRAMLTEDDPLFENWDQDAAAVAATYAAQDPATVVVELIETGADVAAVYAGVRPDQAERTGRRSNGSDFTVVSISRYHLHDVVHHLWDVSGDLPQAP